MEQVSPGEPADRVVSRTLLHKGRKFDFELVSLDLGQGRTAEREFVRHPGAVVIVPIFEDPGGRDQLVLIRNERFGVGQTLLECPAGTAEPGEDPAVTAARELVEETGYEASELISLGWFYTTPGMTDERMHAFGARGLTHVGQALEEDERIEVELVEIDAALAMIASGELRDAKSMLGVLLCERRGLLSNG